MNRHPKIIQLEEYLNYIGYKVERDTHANWMLISPMYRDDELQWTFDDDYDDYEDYEHYG